MYNEGRSVRVTLNSVMCSLAKCYPKSTKAYEEKDIHFICITHFKGFTETNEFTVFSVSIKSYLGT